MINICSCKPTMTFSGKKDFHFHFSICSFFFVWTPISNNLHPTHDTSLCVQQKITICPAVGREVGEEGECKIIVGAFF